MKIFRYIYILLIGMLLTDAVNAQTVLTGVVRDKVSGSPLIGANVFVENAAGRTLDGFVVDVNGEYRLRIPADTDGLNIVFSFIGYKMESVRYTGQSSINMNLESDATIIETATVIGRRVERNPLGIADSESTAASQRITLERLETAPVTNIVEALQGALANVDILTGAEPGANSTIRIRGISSLAGNTDPLIVLDGVPFPVDVSDDFDFSTANSEDFGQLLNISPTDLESIEVLKDATATALWGSRGSNGVLLITTKKGTKGRLTISLSTKWDITKESSTIPLLNNKQYSSMIQDAVWNTVYDIGYANALDYVNILYNTQEIAFDPSWTYFNEYNQETDWVKEITQTGWTTDNSINISGGGEKTTYRLSLGYLKEEGTTIGTAFERFSSSFSMRYRFSDKLFIEANYAITRGITDSNLGNVTGSDISNIRSQAIIKMPNMSPYAVNADGTRTSDYFTPNEYFQGRYPNTFNPVASAYESYNKNRNLSNRLSFNLNYNILPELTYYITLGVNIDDTKKQWFLPQSITGATWLEQYFNRSSDALTDQFHLYTENRLVFVKEFADIHTLTVTGVWRTEDQKTTSYASEVSGNASSSIYDPTVGGIIRSASSGKSTSRRVNATIFGQYMLMDKYIVNAGVNIEASSAMSPNSRWGAFPNAGIAWKMHEENFMSSFDFLSESKLRYSWGVSGNAPTGTGSYFGRFTAVTPGYLDMNAFEPSTIQLDNLKYEKRYSNNFGIDLGFLNYKLNATFEVYINKTKDLLQRNVTVPSSTGYSTVAWYNSGSLRNRGWEFYTDYMAINTKDWSFKVGFNIAQNQIKVLDMPDNVDYYDYTFGNGNYAYKIIEGNPLGSFYGYKYLGVYQNADDTYVKDANGNNITNISGNPVQIKNGEYAVYPGDAKYMDINGDGVIDEKDIVYLGSSLPTLTGGIQLYLTYKDWGLTATFQGRFGQKAVNRTRIDMENMYGKNNQSTAVLARWRSEGDDTQIPRALYDRGYNYLGSDRFIENASFLRLKTLTLKYNVPREVLQRIKINQIEVYATAYDLWTITNYTGQDPEITEKAYNQVFFITEDNAKTPKPVRVALGLNIKF